MIYFPLIHLPQFLFGMALGLIYLFGPPLKPKLHAILFCSGSLGLVLLFAFRFLGLDWLQSEPLLALLYAMIIFGGAQPERRFNALAAPLLVWLGEISYSMYILHVPISFWWNWLVQKQLGLQLGWLIDFASYFSLVLIVSALSFSYVERPLRRRIVGHREHPDA